MSEQQQKKERYIYPEGIYRVRLLGHAVEEGKKRDDGTVGSDSVVLKVEVLAVKKLKNSSINTASVKTGLHEYIRLYLSEKAFLKSKDFLVALLPDFKSFTQLEPGHPNYRDFSGVEFDASCSDDEYMGKKKSKFGALPIGSSGDPYAWIDNLTKANPTTLAKFDAMMGSAATTPTAPAPPVNNAPPAKVNW